VTLLLGIAAVGVVIVPTPPTGGGGGANPTPPGGGGGGVTSAGCACTKLPLVSIATVRTSVESIAPLYRILLRII
jgi:hypothetical protein